MVALDDPPAPRAIGAPAHARSLPPSVSMATASCGGLSLARRPSRPGAPRRARRSVAPAGSGKHSFSMQAPSGMSTSGDDGGSSSGSDEVESRPPVAAAAASPARALAAPPLLPPRRARGLAVARGADAVAAELRAVRLSDTKV